MPLILHQPEWRQVLTSRRRHGLQVLPPPLPPASTLDPKAPSCRAAGSGAGMSDRAAGEREKREREGEWQARGMI